jgi:cupin fold WbuC family metalloprotein
MKRIEAERLQRLGEQAKASPRLRANWNLHAGPEDPVQRFCNAFRPGTYVRPHRHPDGIWECALALRGAAVAVLFDLSGRLVERVTLAAGGPVHGCEIEAGAWHTFAALDGGAVLFEFKPGPYDPETAKTFAQWAPSEGDPASAAFEAWFREGAIGSRPPALPSR